MCTSRANWQAKPHAAHAAPFDEAPSTNVAHHQFGHKPNNQLGQRQAQQLPHPPRCELEPPLCAAWRPRALPTCKEECMIVRQRVDSRIGSAQRRRQPLLAAAACSPSLCRCCGSPGGAATRAAATPRVRTGASDRCASLHSKRAVLSLLTTQSCVPPPAPPTHVGVAGTHGDGCQQIYQPAAAAEKRSDMGAELKMLRLPHLRWICSLRTQHHV